MESSCCRGIQGFLKGRADLVISGELALRAPTEIDEEKGMLYWELTLCAPADIDGEKGMFDGYLALQGNAEIDGGMRG